MRAAAALPCLSAVLSALAAAAPPAAAAGPRYLTPEQQAAVDAAFAGTLPKSKVGWWG